MTLYSRIFKHVVLLRFSLICLITLIRSNITVFCKKTIKALHYNIMGWGGLQVWGCIDPWCVSQVEVQRRPWLYDDEDGQQVGGFVKEFDKIAFLTVKVNPFSFISWPSLTLKSSLCVCEGGGALLLLTCCWWYFEFDSLKSSCRVLVTWFRQTNQLLPLPCSPDSSRDNPTDLTSRLQAAVFSFDLIFVLSLPANRHSSALSPGIQTF